MAEIIIDVTEQIIEVVANNGAYPITNPVYSVFGRIGNIIATEGDYTLNQLGDVNLTSPTNGQVLKYNGTSWINDSDAGIIGTGTTNTLAKFSGTTAIGNSNITDSGSLITLGSNTTISSGGLGIGTTTLTSVNLIVSKNITGGTTALGILSEGAIQSDVTTQGYYFRSNSSTQATTFTMSVLGHYFANQSAFGAGSVVTNQYGFFVNSNLISATNNYGFRGAIPNGSGRYNLYMDGTADNYIAGALGIGTTSFTGYSLNIAKNITGATTSYGVRLQGTVQSDVTTLVAGYGSLLNTAAASFTLTDYVHHRSMQGTIGAGSVVTNQYGYFADSSMIGATNNYAFYSNIASGSNRWNIYMNGTAANFLAGVLNIGSTTLSGFKLDVTGTTRFIGTTASDTAPLGSELANVLGTGTNWTLVGTDLSDGGYDHTTGSIVPLTTSLAAVIGTYYQIAYTITGRTAGTITIAYGGTSTTVSATGATGPLASSTAVLTITPTTDFDGTVVLSIKTIGTSSALSTFASSGLVIATEIRASDISSNLFFGRNNGRRNTTGVNNCFIGSQSGINNTTGSNNTFFGASAGTNNTTNSNNTFIGRNAGSLTISDDNTFLGTNAGNNNTTGNQNTFLGAFAGQSNTIGNNNTIIGRSAGLNNTTGNNNVMIGQSAGRYITGGSISNIIPNQSIFIGNDTRAAADNQTNQIVIGYNTTGLGSNTTIIGNSSTTITGLYGNIRLTSGMGTAPASATATGTLGDIVVTAGFIYVCTATNTWVRTALSTW